MLKITLKHIWKLLNTFFSVENYLNEIHSQALQAATGVNAIPTGAHIRDDEQVSFKLVTDCEKKRFKITLVVYKICYKEII